MPSEVSVKTKSRPLPVPRRKIMLAMTRGWLEKDGLFPYWKVSWKHSFFHRHHHHQNINWSCECECERFYFVWMREWEGKISPICFVFVVITLSSSQAATNGNFAAIMFFFFLLFSFPTWTANGKFLVDSQPSACARLLMWRWCRYLWSQQSNTNYRPISTNDISKWPSESDNFLARFELNLIKFSGKKTII